MLVENNKKPNTQFKVGDTVLIKDTSQTGQITAYENGMWKVAIDGSEFLKESHEIEKRQVLFG